MKTKKKFLIGLMSLCLLGGVGTALALTVTPATGKIQNNVDSAVVFSWGDAEMPAVSQLTGGVPQYTYFSATVDATKSVSGTATVSFKIEPHTDKTDKTAVLKGVTVAVYAGDSNTNSTSMSTYATGDPLFTLDATNNINTDTIELAGSTAVQSVTKVYVLKFLYTSNVDTTLGTNEVLDGQLTLDSSWE